MTARRRAFVAHVVVEADDFGDYRAHVTTDCEAFSFCGWRTVGALFDHVARTINERRPLPAADTKGNAP